MSSKGYVQDHSTKPKEAGYQEVPCVDVRQRTHPAPAVGRCWMPSTAKDHRSGPLSRPSPAAAGQRHAATCSRWRRVASEHHGCRLDASGNRFRIAHGTLRLWLKAGAPRSTPSGTDSRVCRALLPSAPSGPLPVDQPGDAQSSGDGRPVWGAATHANEAAPGIAKGCWKLISRRHGARRGARGARTRRRQARVRPSGAATC